MGEPRSSSRQRGEFPAARIVQAAGRRGERPEGFCGLFAPLSSAAKEHRTGPAGSSEKQSQNVKDLVVGWDCKLPVGGSSAGTAVGDTKTPVPSTHAGA